MNEAHTLTVVAFVSVHWIEVAAVERHVARESVVVVVVRGRTVEAVGTNARDRSPAALASSWQEDGTVGLHQGKVVCTVIVPVPTRDVRSIDAHRLCHGRGMRVAVGEQYHAMHVGHLRLSEACIGHTVHRGGCAGVENVSPLTVAATCQRTPAAVLRVAAVASPAKSASWKWT